MKKILAAVFAVVVTAAWVLPAMAVDTTFYGTYRVRAFSTDNAADYNSKTGDNNSWVDQRFRLNVDSKASDQLRGFVQLEMGNTGGPNRSHVWGSGAASTDQNNRINVRQAYLSFNAGPVRVKAGRSVFGDAPDGGQSFRVSDDKVYWGLLDGGLIVVSQVDAFLFAMKPSDQLAIAAGYVKLAETSTGATPSQNTGATTQGDLDHDLYIVEGVFMPSDALTGAAYLVYDANRSTVTSTVGEDNPWWLGVGVDAKQLGPVNLKVHAAYKGGTKTKGCQPGSCGLASTDSAADLSYAAYALDADASMPVGPATVGVAVGYGSGDNKTDKSSTAFSGVAGAYGVQLGVRPAIFFDSGDVSNGGAVIKTSSANSIDNSTLGNITFAQLYGIYKATDDLTLNGLVAQFQQTETKKDSTEWDATLGTEVDVTAVYKLYKELALVGQAAWFMPGDGILSVKPKPSTATSDTVSEYFAKVQYDF
ncbi:MAG: hypothetical protein HY266_05835 [Deltaproteobacteria bacterium]|nr:hypothetical protein [Deltaproteobacteria bacterium]